MILSSFLNCYPGLVKFSEVESGSRGTKLVLEVHVMRGGAGGGEGGKGEVGMHIKNALKDSLFSNIKKIEDSPYNF